MPNETILDAIEPEIMQTLVTRRDALLRGGKGAALAALASAPLALGALARSAYAQTGTPATVVAVLQYALLLENLEAEFYKAVLGVSGVSAFNTAFAPVRATLTATERATMELIRQHEVAHVAFLRSAISGAGATPATYDAAATFDFTGGRGSGTGPFAAATLDKTFLLAAAQGFEDTGVRAYKGQAGLLLGTGAVLTAALQIHSVEARHAARVRRMRRAAGAPDTVRYSGTVKGGGAAAAGGPSGVALPAAVVAAFAAIYGGEENTNHVVNNGSANATINAASLANLPAGTDVTLAFDEPLPATTVRDIVQPFVIPTVQLPAGLA